MSKQETRMNMYRIGTDTRAARKKMIKTLELAQNGKMEDARKMLGEADQLFEDVKSRHNSMKEEKAANASELKEQEGTIGFTEVFCETIKRACKSPKGSMGAIRFYVYS